MEGLNLFCMHATTNHSIDELNMIFHQGATSLFQKLRGIPHSAIVNLLRGVDNEVITWVINRKAASAEDHNIVQIASQVLKERISC